LNSFLELVQAALKDYVFNLFSEPKVAIALALVLLAIGVLFVGWLVLVKWIPFSLRLRRLEKVIRSTPDEIGLIRDWAIVDEAMQKIQAVRHGWQEFKETLVFPQPETNDPIRNTSRPSNYINLLEAETSGLQIKFIQAVPNYLVGLGLLLTFLGLVAAIYFASQGISANASIEATQDSLKKLLNAATFKFLTSIAGIMSSLLVGISYRLVAGNLQKHFDKLCEALEERLLFVTTESIAFDQYRELQKQTIQLERFNTDLAFSIAKELDIKLNDSLAATFGKALAPLTTTMSTMANKFGEMNQDAVSSMLASFADKLQQSAGSEMKAIGDSLALTKESLGDLVETLQSAGGQLNQTLDHAGQRLQSAATSMEQSIKSGLSDSASKLQEQMEQISKTFHDQFAHSSGEFAEVVSGLSRNAGEMLQPMQQHMEEVTNRLVGLSGGLQQQIDSIARVNVHLGTLVQNIGEASTRLQNAGEPVQKASQAIEAAAVQIALSSKSTIDMQEKLAALANSVGVAVGETTRHWEDYAKRFEQVDKDLANTFKELRDGTAQQQNAVRQFVSEVDKEFGKALLNLGAGVESLQDNLEAFTEAVEKLGTVLSAS